MNYEEQWIIDNILKCCENGDLNTIEQLINQINFDSPYNFKNRFAKKLFHTACGNEQIDIAKFLISSPYSDTHINQEFIITEALEESIHNRKLKSIDYLINDSTLNLQHNFYFSDYLFKASNNDDLDLFKALLNIDNQNYNNISLLDKQSILNEACSKQSHKIIEYVCNTPELTKYVDHDEWFELAAIYSNEKLLSFFIFDLNIQKSEKILNFFEEYDVEEAKEMFTTRDAYNELNNELENKETNSKKLKV